MREIIELMPLLLPYAPACPEPTALFHLRQAAIELCKRTRVWRERKTLHVEGGCGELVCLPSYAAIHEIETAWWNGHRLHREGHSMTCRGEHASMPYSITQTRPDVVRLSPGAAERGTLKLDLFLKPSATAEDIPDFLADHYDQLLADGALGRILLLPNQPFTNPAMGQAFGASFAAGLDRNFNANVRGQQRAPARTRARFV